MSDEYLFISDCHLDPERPQVADALLQFLQERAAAASHLYILGDLFEVWLGDDDPALEHRPVIDALQRLAARDAGAVSACSRNPGFYGLVISGLY